MAQLNLIGYIDERGDLIRKPNSFALNKGPMDPRTMEFLECAGMDLVFTMHARQYAELFERVKAIQAHGTRNEADALLDDMIAMIGGSK
jgi:hypothetical protein